MANIKQQKKRVKVAARERLENLRYRSAIKTYFRRLGVAVDTGDAETVASEHRQLVRLIDRAGAKRAAASEHRCAQEVERAEARQRRPARGDQQAQGPAQGDRGEDLGDQEHRQVPHARQEGVEPRRDNIALTRPFRRRRTLPV
jgi:ribosomal protein S20